MTLTKDDYKIFITSIELPVNLIMARTAVCCATQVADILSFSSGERYDLEVAVEEAFCNGVQHFSGHADSNERIFLEFFIVEDCLVTSIRENGIPFDLSQADKYTPETLEGMNKPGLGMLLMNKGMESVELFVHGRQGKEARLTKKINFGSIPGELLDSQKRKKRKKRLTVESSICRLATLEDLPEICRLAWRCYGYTQEELLYNVDLLTEKFKEGEIKPIVSFDTKSGNMIAHEALKYHDQNVKVSELGLAFIDSSYRCPNETKQLAEVARQVSRANGDLGMFDCSVTTHTYSQKAMQEFVGSSPCSIMMGIMAVGMQTKSIATIKQEKGTSINHYFAFDRSSKTIFVGERHQKMVSEIYEWIDLPRSFEPSSACLMEGESSISVFPLPDELNVSFIIVHRVGLETIDEITSALMKCKQEHKDAVYVFLPLGVETSPYLFEQCEKIGFSFAGIMPHIHDGDDRIIMQWVNICLSPEKIRVYGERSRKLLTYVLDEKERIEKRA